MAYLKIYCDVCGGSWEIYHRDNWKDDKARKCPHCFSKIPIELWAGEIIPAFTATHEANTELYKAHVCRHTPLFSFDIVADHLYENRREIDDNSN